MALSHPGEVHYLLPLVLFFTAFHTAPFASRAFGYMHQPLGTARLGASGAVVACLLLVLSVLLTPSGSVFWDLGAMLLGLTVGLYSPALTTLTSGSGWSSRPEWHVDVWLLCLGVCVMLLRQLHPMSGWILLLGVYAAALWGLAQLHPPKVGEKVAELYQHREGSRLHILTMLTMMGFGFTVRLTRQTAVIWVLIGGVFAFALLAVLERTLRTRSMPAYMRAGIWFAALRNYGWVFPMLCCIAMNRQDLLLGAVACYIAGALIGPILARRHIQWSHALILTLIGVGLIIPGCGTWWMVPGVMLTMIGAFTGKALFRDGLNRDPQIPSSERFMVMARCEGFGAVAQQWIVLGILALGSFGLSKHPGTAVSAYVWHTGISQELAAIYQLSSAVALLIAAATTLLIKRKAA
ncbi:hypothetical protein [Corynebacterium gerontici]|nr:hypothetical protein [Corynebacterium gerontici]